MKLPLAFAVAILAGLPAAASAQEAPRTDPEAGSPSETIYGIPLEEARRDAAPGGTAGTAIRSENGVGSSSRVPGADGTGAADGGTGNLGSGPATQAGDDRRGGQPSRPTGMLASATDPEPSEVGTSVLLALTVLVAAAGGIMATRAAGRAARR